MVCCVSGFKATVGPIRVVTGLIERLAGHEDESAADPLQDSEPKFAKESQVRVCRDSPVEPDSDRHRCGTWLHCGYDRELRLAWRRLEVLNRNSRDVEPSLRARTNRLTAGTVFRRVRAHNDRHHVRRAPSDSGCREQTRHADCCVVGDPLREQTSSVRETEIIYNTPHELV